MSATIQTVHQPQQFYVGMTLQDQRRQFVTNRLKENFPRTFNFTYATIMLLGGVVGIILEVVILGNATYYTSVTGNNLRHISINLISSLCIQHRWRYLGRSNWYYLRCDSIPFW